MRPTEDSLLLSTSVDGKSYLWDKRTDTPARNLILKDNKTPPWALSSCWSADGNMVYVGRRNSTGLFLFFFFFFFFFFIYI